MSEADELTMARALFEKFHERKPRGDEIIRVGGISRSAIALLVGTGVGLGYRTGGEDYYHEFAGTRPRLYVTASGTQIFLIGGVYTFTDRGFIR